jgi:flagellar biosynthesis/type III secretory pathway protein FliH
MPSSEPPVAEPVPVVTYAFEQLEATAPVAGGSPSDVLSAASAEAQHVREQARAAGEAEGRAAGLEEARAEAGTAVAALAVAVKSVQSLHAELVDRFERDAVELALRLAEQVVAGALDVQPERVLDVARGALRRLADRRRVVLTVNPEDLELVADSASALQAELGGIEQCDVQADRRVARGGVIAKTSEGEIEAGIDVQLAQARELVSAALGGTVARSDG